MPACRHPSERHRRWDSRPTARAWSTSGFLVKATGAPEGIYRLFQKGDPLYEQLVRAGCSLLCPIQLYYAVFVKAICMGKVDIWKILADCSYGLMRLFCY